MDISIVTPAFNEEKFILKTIHSIKECMPTQFSYEVLVVDHGSSDKTSSLASSIGAIVVDGSALKTIAALRNLGVKYSKGKTLVFIDADITLTPNWSENISKVIESFQEDPFQICGSHPKIPESSSLLMKFWFEPKSLESSPTHIGSCHLITSRALFDQTQGFPGHMETSEEFIFCINAVEAGAKIISYPELIVMHHGAPKTLLSFISSEIWHGRGDWTSFSTVFSSKVALLTLIFILFHGLLISFVIFGKETQVVTVLLGSSILLLCFASSLIKFAKHGFIYVLLNTYTFYFYFLARGLSLFSAFFSKGIKRRSR